MSGDNVVGFDDSSSESEDNSRVPLTLIEEAVALLAAALEAEEEVAVRPLKVLAAALA